MAYFEQLERLSSFTQIKWIKHALAHSVELHIRANLYSTSWGGYGEYIYRVSLLWQQKWVCSDWYRILPHIWGLRWYGFPFKALYRMQVGELVGWGEVCPCRSYLIWCGILKPDLEKYNYFIWPWFELKLKYKIKVLYLKKKIKIKEGGQPNLLAKTT